MKQMQNRNRNRRVATPQDLYCTKMQYSYNWDILSYTSFNNLFTFNNSFFVIVFIGGLQTCGQKFVYFHGFSQKFSEQECIPVGCVPSAGVAICRGDGGVCLGGSAQGGGVCPGDVCPGVCVCGECLAGGYVCRGGLPGGMSGGRGGLRKKY